MMGPLVDERVEAVAGKPFRFVRTPTYGPKGTAQSVVFVGVTPTVISIRCAMQSRNPMNADQAVNAYWNGQLVLAGARRLNIPNHIAVFAPALPGNDLFLGTSLAKQDWAEPFIIAVYDHALSDAQALEVARRLTLSL